MTAKWVPEPIGRMGRRVCTVEVSAVTSVTGPTRYVHRSTAWLPRSPEDAAAGVRALEPPGQRPPRIGGVAGEEDAAHVGDPAEPAAGDQLTDVLDGRRVPVVEADRGDHPGRLGGPRHRLGLVEAAADGLLDPEVLARLGGGHPHLRVQEVGRADRDDVDLGVRQHLAVVGGPGRVAQHVDRILGSARFGVRGDDQPRRDPELRIGQRDRLVGLGVQLAHPPDTDQAHPGASCHSATRS